jgi:hypothetical protein
MGLAFALVVLALGASLLYIGIKGLTFQQFYATVLGKKG